MSTEVVKNNLFMKGFNLTRNHLKSSIESFEKIQGNAKYIADALTVMWSELYLLFNGRDNQKVRAVGEDLLRFIFNEFEKEKEMKEFMRVYLFLTLPFTRGFDLDESTTSAVEEWLRDLLIKATDYLLYPECIKTYKDYEPTAIREDFLQTELFDWLKEDLSFVREYGDLIRILIRNKHI